MLKPGQHTLSREYYKDVTTVKPDGDEVLRNYERFRSVYDQNSNANVKVGDYKVPAKSMNTMTGYELVHKPTLFNHTALGR
jgi:DNA/RNA endonuclease G (NUC1)